MGKKGDYRLDFGICDACLSIAHVSPAVSINTGFFLEPDACPLLVEQGYKAVFYHAQIFYLVDCT